MKTSNAPTPVKRQRQLLRGLQMTQTLNQHAPISKSVCCQLHYWQKSKTFLKVDFNINMDMTCQVTRLHSRSSLSALSVFLSTWAVFWICSRCSLNCMPQYPWEIRSDLINLKAQHMVSQDQQVEREVHVWPD